MLLILHSFHIFIVLQYFIFCTISLFRRSLNGGQRSLLSSADSPTTRPVYSPANRREKKQKKCQHIQSWARY